MLEQFCSKKRMIILIILLGLLTVLFLILEEALTAKEHTPTPTPNNLVDNLKQIPSLDRNSVSEKPSGILTPKSSADADLKSQISSTEQPCWVSESFTIVKSCSPCSNFEIESGSKPACVETGLHEQINCSSKGLVYPRCVNFRHFKVRVPI